MASFDWKLIAFQSGVASKIPKCRYTGIFEIIHIAIPVFEKIPVYRFSLLEPVVYFSRRSVQYSMANFLAQIVT